MSVSDAMEVVAEPVLLSPKPRTRRRDFKTPSRTTTKGRSLLLHDSDDEGQSREPSDQPKSAPAVPEISFQDIMSNLALEEAENASSVTRPNPTLRPYSTDASSFTSSRPKHLSDLSAIDTGMAGSRREVFDARRRHSATPSVGSAFSQRRSVESFARTPLRNSSSISLVEPQGLSAEDMVMFKGLKRRQAIMKELVTTELSFSQDLAVVVQEYQRNTDSCPNITSEDVRQIFGDVESVLSFSNDLAFELQVAAASALFSDTLELQTLHYEDSKTTIGAVFNQYTARLTKVFARYCSSHEIAASCLRRISKDPAVQTWLADRHPTDRTTAWDLPSLLIKPVQRIMKYPLLLSTLLEATPRLHPDWEAMNTAAKDMLSAAETINNIKKRRDLVGQIAADRERPADNSVLSKTFQRKGTRSRVASSASAQPEYTRPDLIFDRLAQAFRAQETVVQNLKIEIQEWLAAMRSALDYHSNLASTFCDVSSVQADVSATPQTFRWHDYAPAISDLIQGAFVNLSHSLQKEVFSPLASIEGTFIAPARVLARRNHKAEDYHRARINRERAIATPAALSSSADEYLQLNETLIQELPTFLSINRKAMDCLLARLASLQSEWYRAWHTRFTALLPEESLSLELLSTSACLML